MKLFWRIPRLARFVADGVEYVKVSNREAMNRDGARVKFQDNRKVLVK